MNNKHVVIIGGGAAGFFAAINIAESAPGCFITILEKSDKLLSKVKVSGGGRCNVTNVVSDPAELVQYYPRGNRELTGSFHSFSTKDTVLWFEKRGVPLKAEADGRMFPAANTSEAVINCFLRLADKNKINIIKKSKITGIIPGTGKHSWIIKTTEDDFKADKLLISSGSNEQVWSYLSKLGHKIEKPVPSLFTFNVKDNKIHGLPGISVNNALVKVEGTSLTSFGPVLITHWGLSGPAILKLSAWGARELFNKKYNFILLVNWISLNREEAFSAINKIKQENAGRLISLHPQLNLPGRLWEKLCNAAGISDEIKWSGASRSLMSSLADVLTSSRFNVAGKSTFKDEFVTCGGVNLKEVDFKTMESKLHKNLYFAGEVLDIDALTGGFNFQAAWTTAWIAAGSIAKG